VRVGLTTGTNDALTAAVAERRPDASFVAEAPTADSLMHLPPSTESLVLVSAESRWFERSRH